MEQEKHKISAISYERMNEVKNNYRCMMGMVASGVTGTMIMRRRYKKKLEGGRDGLQKMHEFYELLIEWLALKQEGRNLSEYFIKKGYQTIAVYGMKELGVRLCHELAGTDVSVKYALDKRNPSIEEDINLEIYRPDKAPGFVDAVVITAIHYFDDIERELSEILPYPVISLEDAVYGMSYIL